MRGADCWYFLSPPAALHPHRRNPVLGSQGQLDWVSLASLCPDLLIYPRHGRLSTGLLIAPASTPQVLGLRRNQCNQGLPSPFHAQSQAGCHSWKTVSIPSSRKVMRDFCTRGRSQAIRAKSFTALPLGNDFIWDKSRTLFLRSLSKTMGICVEKNVKVSWSDESKMSEHPKV